MAERKGWEHFARLRSPQPGARDVDPGELVNMAGYADALDVFVAYAQDNHLFDANGRPVAVEAAAYRQAPRLQKVNKFGRAYREDAQLWLHKDMAEIVVDAARFMQERYGWRSMVYDGLRTVDGAYIIYRNAEQSDIDDKLLAPPGLSAHNKGMAVDLTMFDREGKLVDMGGNFDHLDMKANHRNNRNLPLEVIENRRKREVAFQHAALSHGRLFAPLRSEFWDERFPENEADHWRVLESLCRCVGKEFDDVGAAMDYREFQDKWRELFDDAELRAALGLGAEVALPPERGTVIYHGDFHPLYDRDLMASGKSITDNALDNHGGK